MAVTIRDVARTARVSVTTVSRVLSGSDHPVAAEVRQRVLQVAHRLNYTPNAFALGLRKRESQLIGLLIPDVQDPYFPAIARGVEDVANEQSYLVVLCNTDRNTEKEASYVEELQSHRAGLIFAGGAINRGDHLAAISNYPTPVVVVGRHDLPCSSVLIDNVRGAIDATTHLIELGCRHIAFIGGPSNSTTAVDRQQGFREAIVGHGLPVDDALMVGSDFTIESGELGMRELLDRGKPIDGLFAASDTLAIGAMREARRLGLAIPRDLAIVGFNDIDMAIHVEPSLTTVRLPLRRIGQMAAEMLIKQLKCGPSETASVPIRGELVVRESTKAKDER